MSPTTRALLKSFIENKAQYDAVRTVLLEATSDTASKAFLSSIDKTSDDATFGRTVRVRVEALELLENGFAQLTTLANGAEGVQSRKNEAR